ncbi:MAG: GNAT family N-acetyltransferase [Chlamydiales bacterium]|nr:GNAT family N-acetyltransferase [Chlamydiales bacterium]
MENKEITIRLAVSEDLEAIKDVMKSSMQTLGQGHYSEQQIKSCCQYVCVPDLQLIKDRTFFVAITPGGSIIGCGGWSFRNTLYAGPSLPSSHEINILDPDKDPARIRAMFIIPSASGKGIGSLILSASEKAAKERGFLRGALGSTLSGLSFYKSKGWQPSMREQAILPDGVAIDVVKMEKSFFEV